MKIVLDKRFRVCYYTYIKTTERKNMTMWLVPSPFALMIAGAETDMLLVNVAGALVFGLCIYLQVKFGGYTYE